MNKIITITCNPAIDKSIYDDREVFDIGGKGINVSKTLKVLGLDSICIGFVGKDNKELQRYAIKNYLNTRLRCYKKLLYNNKDDKTIRNDYLREVNKYKNIPYTKKEKLELFLLKYIPGIYKIINKKYYDKKYNKMF